VFFELVSHKLAQGANAHEVKLGYIQSQGNQPKTLISSVSIAPIEKIFLMLISFLLWEKWERLPRSGWRATTLPALTKSWGTYPHFNLLTNMPKCPLRSRMDLESLTYKQHQINKVKKNFHFEFTSSPRSPEQLTTLYW